MAIVTQPNTGTVSKATLGTFLRDGRDVGYNYYHGLSGSAPNKPCGFCGR